MQRPTLQRLQKLLADNGIGSRRRIEHLIVAGQIKVNGKVADLGSKASRSDRIAISDKEIHLQMQPNSQTLIYHKPLGTIVSRNDPESRTSVFENLPKLRNSRWISVGRLDINTSGLLLFCTDGILAHKLMHPSSKIERTYLVRVRGKVSDTVINRLRTGVMLEDGMACFSQISVHYDIEHKQWYKVVVFEGRNRLIRRLWLNQGLLVTKLIRIGFGSFELPSDCLQGMYKTMTKNELKRLYQMAKLALP